MQDADESVRQAPECVVMFDSFGALLVVEGAGAREAFSAANAWALSASTSRSLWTNLAETTFFFPEARVTGLVAA